MGAWLGWGKNRDIIVQHWWTQQSKGVEVNAQRILETKQRFQLFDAIYRRIEEFNIYLNDFLKEVSGKKNEVICNFYLCGQDFPGIMK